MIVWLNSKTQESKARVWKLL